MELKIYTDGSYRPPEARAGWAFAAVRGSVIEHWAAGLTPNPALSRNIDGECEAVAQAVEWCHRNCHKQVTIVHDYAGLAHWPKGEWKASSQVALDYLARLRACHVEITWVKIRGHSGNAWNDYVDALAGRAVRGEL